VTALLCEAMEARDRFTLGHGKRVSESAALLASELGLSAAAVIGIAEPMHCDTQAGYDPAVIQALRRILARPALPASRT
jgi:hypothetical protein